MEATGAQNEEKGPRVGACTHVHTQGQFLFTLKTWGQRTPGTALGPASLPPCRGFALLWGWEGEAQNIYLISHPSPGQKRISRRGHLCI